MKRKRSFIDRLLGIGEDFDDFEEYDDCYYRPERMKSENKIIIQTEEYKKGNTKEVETRVILPQDVLETFKGMSEMYRIAESKRLIEKEKLLKSNDVRAVSEILKELDEVMIKFSNLKFDNYSNSKDKWGDKDERSNE